VRTVCDDSKLKKFQEIIHVFGSMFLKYKQNFINAQKKKILKNFLSS
jgi:hypothetical protein